MKFDDLTIFRDEFPPFEKVNKPTEYTRAFLTMLLDDPFFQETVIDVRQEMGINKNGLNSSKIILNKQFLKLSKHRAVKSFIDYFLSVYRLPEPYTFQLFLLIIYNSFIDSNHLEDAGIMYSSYKGDMNYKFAQESKKSYGSIYIFSKVTKKEFIQWINKNWRFIESEMNTFLPEIPTAGSKYKNLYIAKEIDELKNLGKSYQEIADILSVKYEDNDQVVDTGWLKSTLSRYRGMSTKFRNRIENNTSVTF